MRALILFVICLTIPLQSYAFNDKRNGLSGEISLTTGVTMNSSNLSTNSSKQIGSLNHSEDLNSNFLIAPIGELAYNFNGGNSGFYIGQDRSDIAVGTLAFQIGYRQTLASGMDLSVAYIPTIIKREVWEDPYLVGVKRNETEVDGQAYRIKLDRVARFLNLEFAYGTRDIENEQITDPSLKRDSNMYYGTVGTFFPISRGLFLSPKIKYLHNDADGEAATYDRFGFDLTTIGKFNSFDLALTLGYANNDYAAESSLFSNTREDKELRFFAAYEKAGLLNINNLYFVTLLGYKDIDSNINFYDSEEVIAMIGTNLKF